jgi:hypothetical protein
VLVAGGGGDGQPQSWPRMAASFPPGVAVPVTGPGRGPDRTPPSCCGRLALYKAYVRMEDVPCVGNIVIPGNHKEL